MLMTTKNLVKSYGKHVAVNNLNLQINRGSFTAILGPNGAGKSTTMGMLTGNLTPSSGTIQYEPGTKIGIVFQTSVLDANLTVRENLESRAKQYKNVKQDKIETLVDQLGLKAFTRQKYHTLSGGQKRRVDIARALLNEPDILYLDEPTTGLDIQTRNAIWQLLKELQDKHQLTIVLTTHYLNEVNSADSVYIIDHGQTIAHGTATTIKEQFAPNRLLVKTDDKGFEKIIGNNEFKKDGGNYEVLVDSPKKAIEIIVRGKDLIQNFQFYHGTMDDAFIALTGKEIR
ncbi:ABC transporter ATP-binding protein [Pediococcus siamensis]|uniref:ABC transporter ATP-binding protein n=1 Tax=Pediococcus siamensis TaxID=381829 RepID=UPI0039A2D1EC